jgi:hypothetical protein
MNSDAFKAAVLEGIPQSLPPRKSLDPSLNHAPRRRDILTDTEKRLALQNALRYIPVEHMPSLRRNSWRSWRLTGGSICIAINPTMK